MVKVIAAGTSFTFGSGLHFYERFKNNKELTFSNLEPIEYENNIKNSYSSLLAKKFDGEIISADSRQIYRGMDIGTGKDQPGETPIHLIDLITPDQKFSVAQFQKVGLEIINKLHSQNKLPILVGCSGFYLDSLIEYHIFFVFSI